MSHNFCISQQISPKRCVYVDYVTGYCTSLKVTALLWKQTSCQLWKDDFDCINMTVKFWYWFCGDAQCNWKNLVACLKDLMQRAHAHQLVHTNSTLYTRISPQWLSMLRWLKPSIPGWAACELFSLIGSNTWFDGIVSPNWFCPVKGEFVFKCNLPPSPLAV